MENGTGAQKQPGKRKRDSQDAPFNGHSEGHASATLNAQTTQDLLEVLTLLDASLLDAPIDPPSGSSKNAKAKFPSLRAALETRPPISIDILRLLWMQTLAGFVVSSVLRRQPPLPDLPSPPANPQKRRSEAEEHALVSAQAARIEAADSIQAIRERLDRWKAQLEALLDELQSRLHQPDSVLEEKLEDTSAEAPRTRTRASKGHQGSLAARPLQPQQGVADLNQKVVLHRGLLNSVDLYSSTGEITVRDLKENPYLAAQLQGLEDTDIVGVESLEGSTHQRQPPGTLNDISLPPLPSASSSKAGKVADPQAVRNLYYDPFSSFAPTYDSSDANLSYDASARWGAAQDSAKDHSKMSLLAQAYEKRPATSSSSSSDVISLQEADLTVDDALAHQLGLSSSADLARVLDVLPSDADIPPTDKALQSISSLLMDLQLSQLDRLRQQAAHQRMPISAPKGKDARPGASVKLSELESLEAVEVLEKLIRIAERLPPGALTSQKRSTSSNDHDAWLERALTAPVLEMEGGVADEKFPGSYLGTLPSHGGGVLRESLLTRIGSSAKRTKK